METSLPVLVTRLKDRDAVAPFVRAALRHEVTEVRLETAPGAKGPHTLSFEVGGAPVVSLHAEITGSPRRGFFFPVRLKPLHRAQAAELYALLEEAQDLAPDEEDDDDVVRAGPRGTIRMDVPYTGDDPLQAPLRETAKSATFAPGDGVDASDRSISVVFEPDDLAEPHGADFEEPSLSVSVVIEPDAPPPSAQVPISVDEELAPGDARDAVLRVAADVGPYAVDVELPLERRAAGRGWDVPWPLLPGHYTASVVLGDDAKPQARPTFEITAGATTRVSGPELGLSPPADAPPR